MRSGNHLLKLGELLIQTKDIEKLDPLRTYKLLGIRLHGNGVFLREEKHGSNINAATLNKVKRQEFIFSRLFAWKGSFGLIPEEFDGCYVSNEFPTFHIDTTRILPKYLEFYFKQQPVWKEVEKLCEGTTAVSRNRLKEKHFLDIEIALPQLAKQEKTVAVLERLESEIEGIIRQPVRANIEALRYSILRAAFEGKLTAEWRKSHTDKIKPEVAVSKPQENRDHKKAKSRCEDLSAVDISSLPRLSENWTWTQVREVTDLLQYGTSRKAGTARSGIPVLRMGNIQDGRLVFDNLKYLPAELPFIEDFLLHDGDVLFNRTNSRKLVGKTAVYKNYYPKAIFASYLIRLRVDSKKCLPDFLAHYINSYYGTRYIASVVSQQVGQANVNGKKLSMMPFPLAPLAEQERIIMKIEQFQSHVKHLKQLDSQISAIFICKRKVEMIVKLS
jgi:type I restriction enzyme S subunit